MNWSLRIVLLICVYLTLGAVAGAQTRSSPCDFSLFRPIRISHALQNAVLEFPKPRYPKAASAVNASGRVSVKVMIDLEGNVVRACALKGHPLLRHAAVEAAKAARFKPNFGLSLPQKQYKRRYLEDEITFTFKGKESDQ